jgi:hypothetical protein
MSTPVKIKHDAATQTDNHPQGCLGKVQGWLGEHKVTLLVVAVGLLTGGLGFIGFGIAAVADKVMTHFQNKKKIQNLQRAGIIIKHALALGVVTRTTRTFIARRADTQREALVRAPLEAKEKGEKIAASAKAVCDAANVAASKKQSARSIVGAAALIGGLAAAGAWFFTRGQAAATTASILPAYLPNHTPVPLNPFICPNILATTEFPM